MGNDSYLGASDAQQIYPENTVDFLTVVDTVSQYRLSQDVPGAYEGNVLVVRNGYVLEQESEYSIDYNTQDGINNLITFLVPLLLTDNIYVIHKGVATYNMAPSPRSVTEDSLSENLRDFITEFFDGDTTETEFTLIKQEFQSRSMIVYVDGAIQRPYINSATSDPDKWEFKVEQIDETTSKIVFRLAPTAGTHNICVLHLAFSTVLRRSDYLTDLVLSPNLIQTQHINPDAVDGSRILLDANNALYPGIRSLRVGGGRSELIKLNTSNQAEIFGTIVADTAKLAPKTDNTFDLGTVTERYKAVRSVDVVSDTVTTTDIEVDDIQAQTATFDDEVTVQDLNVNGTFNLGGTSIDSIPLGAILPWFGKNWALVATQVPYDKYLLCDGSAVPGDAKYYPFAAYLSAQGLTPGFVPNMCEKFPMGGLLPTDCGSTGGSSTHTHSIPDHNHSLKTADGAVVVLQDTGHTHSVGTFNITIPNHTHFLNPHFHKLFHHDHQIFIRHKHSVYITSTTSAHHHAVPYINQSVQSGAGFTVRQLTGTNPPPNTVATDPESPAHSHLVSGTTTVPPVPDGTDLDFGSVEYIFTKMDIFGEPPSSSPYGYPARYNRDITTNILKFRVETYDTTGGILDPGGKWNNVDAVRPWDQVTYNRANNIRPTVGGQNDMSQGTAQVFNVANGFAGASATANVANYMQINPTSSSATANKTSLSTNTNTATMPPFLTVNYIIRAVP